MNRENSWQQKTRLKLTDNYCYKFLSLSLSFPGLAAPFCGEDERWPSAPSCNSPPIWWRSFFTPVSIVYFSASQMCVFFTLCLSQPVLQNVFTLLPFSLKPPRQICFWHTKKGWNPHICVDKKTLLGGWKAAQSCGESFCPMGHRSDSPPKESANILLSKRTRTPPSLSLYSFEKGQDCTFGVPTRLQLFHRAQNEWQSVTRVSRETSVLCVISCKHTQSHESLYWRAGTLECASISLLAGNVERRQASIPPFTSYNLHVV